MRRLIETPVIAPESNFQVRPVSGCPRLSVFYKAFTGTMQGPRHVSSHENDSHVFAARCGDWNRYRHWLDAVGRRDAGAGFRPHFRETGSRDRKPGRQTGPRTVRRLTPNRGHGFRGTGENENDVRGRVWL